MLISGLCACFKIKINLKNSKEFTTQTDKNKIHNLIIFTGETNN